MPFAVCRFTIASRAGKSTIVLKVAKQFYEDIDCGTLSNNIESKFGLSQFHDKLLFVAPEIKSDLKIEQARVRKGRAGKVDVLPQLTHSTTHAG